MSSAERGEPGERRACGPRWDILLAPALGSEQLEFRRCHATCHPTRTSPSARGTVRYCIGTVRCGPRSCPQTLGPQTPWTHRRGGRRFLVGFSSELKVLKVPTYSIPGGNSQPLSLCFSCVWGGSALPLSTTRCPFGKARQGKARHVRLFKLRFREVFEFQTPRK